MKKIILTIFIVLVVIVGSYFLYNILTNKEVFQFKLNSGEIVHVVTNKSLYIINTDNIDMTGNNNECTTFFEITLNSAPEFDGTHYVIMPYENDDDYKRLITIYYKNEKIEKVFNFIINTKDKIIAPDTCKEN